MQEFASGRAKTYAVLAALYTVPPTKELADAIREGNLPRERGGALAEALTESFRRGADEQADNDLVAEHTRLFVLPSGVVPNESYYADQNQRVGGHVTAEVQRFYDAAAAQLTGACLEMPDHIGVELEFMKFLCDIERQFRAVGDPDGLQRCLDFQSGFLEAHLLRWHKRLCERILAETNSDVYRALARLTLEFLEEERAYVPELTGKIQSDSEWRTACVS
jgi:TorA maturation chaperone TorD